MAAPRVIDVDSHVEESVEAWAALAAPFAARRRVDRAGARAVRFLRL